MTSSDRFDRDLESWLHADAPVIAPIDLHGAAIGTIASRRQRPSWLVALRGGTFGATSVASRPAFGASRLFVILALLITVLSVAAVVGAGLLSDQLPPTHGRNGSIAYSVFENGQRRGQHSAFHTVAPDGTGDRRIGFGTCPTYSRDGASVIYRSNRQSNEVVLEAADGSARTTVLANHDYFHPSLRTYALSPDGTRIAYFQPVRDSFFPDEIEIHGTRTELWVAPVGDAPGTPIVPVATDPYETFWNPSWSPDGLTIAFEGHLTQATGFVRTAVYLVDVDGSDLRRLTTRPAAGDTRGPSFSPDGRSIAYLGLPDGAALAGRALDVFVIRVDGTGDRNLTNSAGFDRRPAWSPDGSRLAFLTGDTPDPSESRLAVVDVGTSDPPAPQVGPPSDAVAWSPDGAQLLSIRGNDVRTIDAQLRAPLATLIQLASNDGAVTFSIETDCPPSWQRLDP